MNWFEISELIKTAAVWTSDVDDGTYQALITRFYALEYKRGLLKNFSFRGVDRRRDNILAQIEASLSSVITHLKPPLLKTLQVWLEGHAISNPAQWANARLKENVKQLEKDGYIGWGTDRSQIPEEEHPISRALLELYNRSPYRVSYDHRAPLRRFVMDVLDHYENDPSEWNALKKVDEMLSHQRGQEMLAEYHQYGAEEFAKTYGTFTFHSDQEVTEWIMAHAEGRLRDNIDDVESLIAKAEEADEGDAVAGEIYRNLTFPAWFAVFKPQGIEKTRQNVEETYQRLLSAKTIDESIIAINWALHTNHQNGAMLDYLGEYGGARENGDHYGDQDTDTSDLKRHLDLMSRGDMNRGWADEMRGVGVDIPNDMKFTEKDVADANKPPVPPAIKAADNRLPMPPKLAQQMELFSDNDAPVPQPPATPAPQPVSHPALPAPVEPIPHHYRQFKQSGMFQKLWSLRPQFAAAAQNVYNEWQQDEEGNDEVLGGGGICQDIAEAIGEVCTANGLDAISRSAACGEQHVWCVVYRDPDGEDDVGEAFDVDIPYHIYERGGGYNWTKIPDVVFDPSDITLTRAEQPSDEDYF